jgi:hypothetical protein
MIAASAALLALGSTAGLRAPEQRPIEAPVAGNEHGLLTEVAAPEEPAELAWRRNDTGAPIGLLITDAGLGAIAAESTAVDAAEPAARRALDAGIDMTAPEAAEQAAKAILVESDDEAGDRADLITAIDARRALLAKAIRPIKAPGAARNPRTGTQQEQGLGMLHRSDGVTLGQIAEVTGWLRLPIRPAGRRCRGARGALRDMRHGKRTACNAAAAAPRRMLTQHGRRQVLPGEAAACRVSRAQSICQKGCTAKSTPGV